MREKNNSGSVFLAGVVVGVLVTLLFTTKKGRKILKNLKDQGMEMLEQMADATPDDLAEDAFPQDGIDDEIPEKNTPARKGMLRNLRKN